MIDEKQKLREKETSRKRTSDSIAFENFRKPYKIEEGLHERLEL